MPSAPLDSQILEVQNPPTNLRASGPLNTKLCLALLSAVPSSCNKAVHSLLTRSSCPCLTAPQALGLLFIARPSLMVDVKIVTPILTEALAPSAPSGIKMRCLANLADLLRAEEESLLLRQKEVSCWREWKWGMHGMLLPRTCA